MNRLGDHAAARMSVPIRPGSTPELIEEPMLFHLRHSEDGQPAIETISALIQNWFVALRTVRRCDIISATESGLSTMRVQRAGFSLSKAWPLLRRLACQVLNIPCRRLR
jgi:hypothetical protein